MPAIPIILKYWQLIVGGIAVAILGVMLLIAKGDARHWQKQAVATQAAFDQTVANYRTAAATAKANNLNEVRSAETDGAQIAEESQHDLQTQLASARALADDYARRLRAGTATVYPGGTAKGSVPATPGGPGAANGAGPLPVMASDDLQVCTENTVKAQGWQDFYAAVRARYAAMTAPTP